MEELETNKNKYLHSFVYRNSKSRRLTFESRLLDLQMSHPVKGSFGRASGRVGADVKGREGEARLDSDKHEQHDGVDVQHGPAPTSCPATAAPLTQRRRHDDK